MPSSRRQINDIITANSKKGHGGELANVLDVISTDNLNSWVRIKEAAYTKWIIEGVLAGSKDWHGRTIEVQVQWPMLQQRVEMTLLIVVVFWHMKLGLRVLVEDYVHRSHQICSHCRC